MITLLKMHFPLNKIDGIYDFNHLNNFSFDVYLLVINKNNLSILILIL